jgi:ribosomal protein S18 acetylase RimI-like enzyme
MGASAERKPTNRQEKRTLVKQGRSHGIIVYAKGEPIGWCQYGTKEELPRIESNTIYRKIAPTTSDKLWRITCFVTSRQYRKRGVASTALTATLEAIKKNGGGIVEAYPIVRWGAYAEYRGTASMFKKHGFMIVDRLGRSNVLMRKTIKN